MTIDFFDIELCLLIRSSFVVSRTGTKSVDPLEYNGREEHLIAICVTTSEKSRQNKP